MEDRHRKLRRQLYYLIPFGVFWVCIGIFTIVVTSGASFFFTVFVVAIVSFGCFGLFRRIRRILLDLRELPVEVEGLLLDKRRVRDGEGGTSQYLRIDTLGFDLGCGENEWDTVDKGDKVRIVYHRHSECIESITVMEKAV